MNTNVTMIPVAQLHPHPDNPRKDLGDITELTASIKANGVLQNLTVVPRANHDVNYEELCRQYYADPTEENRTKLNQFRNTDGYTVIIGHRRLAAAKAARLAKLPCIVVEDMTPEEQISTMMTENMQRSDLTVYEEAEGFQMMMDFGNSVEQVADKAGFSESTIRRRVKLLSLDREEFKKSVKRGATLADFALLDKLDTEEAKNEVLKSVGTNNFRACLDRALREQKDRKTMNAIREVVASYATKADSKADMPENCLFYASYGSWSRIAEAPADAGEHAYWYTESGYGITVYRERTEEDELAEKTPEQLAREAKIEEYREKCRVIEEDEESAYRLRLNYLKEYGLQILDVLILENRSDDFAFVLVVGIHNMAVHAALWGDGGIPHTLPAAALVVYGLVGLVGRAHKAGAYRAVVVGNDLCGCLTGDACEFDFNAEVLVLDGNHCGGLP